MSTIPHWVEELENARSLISIYKKQTVQLMKQLDSALAALRDAAVTSNNVEIVDKINELDHNIAAQFLSVENNCDVVLKAGNGTVGKNLVIATSHFHTQVVSEMRDLKILLKRFSREFDRIVYPEDYCGCNYFSRFFTPGTQKACGIMRDAGRQIKANRALSSEQEKNMVTLLTEFADTSRWERHSICSL